MVAVESVARSLARFNVHVVLQVAEPTVETAIPSTVPKSPASTSCTASLHTRSTTVRESVVPPVSADSISGGASSVVSVNV